MFLVKTGCTTPDLSCGREGENKARTKVTTRIVDIKQGWAFIRYKRLIDWARFSVLRGMADIIGQERLLSRDVL